jgi:hypothetical protein
MAVKPIKKPVAVISAVIILLSLGALFLINNFGEVGFGDSWPVLCMAVGLCLAVGGMLELGLGIMGLFLLLLLSELEVFAFAKSWPIILIWVAILVVVGYLRSRFEEKKKTS